MTLSFRQYIVKLMKDERGGVIALILKGILRVLSWAYSLGVKIVDWSYLSGFRPIHKVAVPVISVGNITLGGTGKTPFTMFLSDYFSSAGNKPAVLIRGYGRDEDRMLDEGMPDVPVFVGQDRVVNARRAIAEGSDVLILDDGFQHRRIARDLNILMIDSTLVSDNAHIFPRGVLREPFGAMKRADMFILTKTDRAGDENKENIINKLAGIAPGRPVVMTRHSPSCITDAGDTVYPVEFIKGKKVCLVSGIADPGYFAFLAESLGADIVSRTDHEDHHCYTQDDVNRAAQDVLLNNGDMILVTKKDHVKIKDLDISGIKDKLFILNVKIDVVSGEEGLIAGLNSVISG